MYHIKGAKTMNPLIIISECLALLSTI
uniref:Uncharacterized protein n=1 Tax=Anguilla anguilla TaxID=7936 RepID=A0A0E9R7W7_ANGAN